MPTAQLSTSQPKGCPAANLEQVAGCLHSKRKPKTLAQMRVALKRELARRRELGRY